MGTSSEPMPSDAKPPGGVRRLSAGQTFADGEEIGGAARRYATAQPPRRTLGLAASTINPSPAPPLFCRPSLRNGALMRGDLADFALLGAGVGQGEDESDARGDLPEGAHRGVVRLHGGTPCQWFGPKCSRQEPGRGSAPLSASAVTPSQRDDARLTGS